MYHNLCLGGGGIKLISFIGIIKYLFDNKYLIPKSLKNFIGVSAGSIICFLLNIGYTIEEMEDFALNFNFNKLLPETNTENLLFFYGLGTSEKIKRVLSLLCKNKLDLNDLTFNELHQKTKINLQIGITNLSTNEFELWNYQNKPNISVVDAITISCNLPFIFKPIKINNEYFIDGGVLNNFPINYFNKDELHNTLGICCDHKKNHSFDNIFEYISKIFSMITSNIDTIKIQNYQDKVDIIKITSLDDTLDFNLSPELIKDRINYGYLEAKKFFSNRKLNKRRHSI